MFSSQKKESAYPEQVERMVNKMIAAYTDAELAYAQAAANAASEKVGLENFAHYFQVRAREINEQRNFMVRYQARRSSTAPQEKEEQFQQRQPMKTARTADEMKDIMRHLADLEKELEEMWRKLCEIAAEIKDAMSKHFAERHITYQHHRMEKAARMYNTVQQMSDLYQMDNTAMKNEMEKRECQRHHCQGCSYYEYPSEDYYAY
uniref:Ferritin-like domain n=1 Tax=Schistocephalus solidus TaxID=70667 RepID=A0A0X3NZD4_SCHSO